MKAWLGQKNLLPRWLTVWLEVRAGGRSLSFMPHRSCHGVAQVPSWHIGWLLSEWAIQETVQEIQNVLWPSLGSQTPWFLRLYSICEKQVTKYNPQSRGRELSSTIGREEYWRTRRSSLRLPHYLSAEQNEMPAIKALYSVFPMYHLLFWILHRSNF